MPNYNIDPPGVKTVLTSTGTEAGKFETDLTPLEGHVNSAATGCGNSGAIVPALSTFFDVQGKRLTAVGTRVNACITGAAEATNAYVRGDLDMLATYQTNASQLVISKPPQ